MAEPAVRQCYFVTGDPDFALVVQVPDVAAYEAFTRRFLYANPDVAKYINSPETPVFSKSSMLYGLDTAREAMGRSRRAIVVEGYTDCLAARQAGIDDVVAVLGTALGERHAKLLRRHADTIVLVLDGDDAGRRRADEILDVILAEPIDVRIARMPSGVDPCDLILEQGRDAFEALVAEACDPLDYRMDEVLAGLAADAGDDAALASVESVLKALAAAASRSSLAGSQARLREDQVLGRLARRCDLQQRAGHPGRQPDGHEFQPHCGYGCCSRGWSGGRHDHQPEHCCQHRLQHRDGKRHRNDHR
jgi:DNA primase